MVPDLLQGASGGTGLGEGDVFFFFFNVFYLGTSPVAQWVKNLPAMQETQETRVQPLDQEDPLEEEMVTHSSILAWKIPWTEEPGMLYRPWGCKSRT